jgi:hypothetical protein
MYASTKPSAVVLEASLGKWCTSMGGECVAAWELSGNCEKRRNDLDRTAYYLHATRPTTMVAIGAPQNLRPSNRRECSAICSGNPRRERSTNNAGRRS